MLAGELGSATDTIAKLVQLSSPNSRQSGDATTRRASGSTPSTTPSLIVIDEAGKASTAELDTVISHALARGRACGSSAMTINWRRCRPAECCATSAAHRHTLTLSEVVRFGETARGRAEAATSLALRAGDPAGIAFYLDHQRVHVGPTPRPPTWPTNLAERPRCGP